MTLADKLDAITLENKALKADAERYRFLRDNPTWQVYMRHRSNNPIEYSHEYLDAALDAVRKETGSE